MLCCAHFQTVNVELVRSLPQEGGGVLQSQGLLVGDRLGRLPACHHGWKMTLIPEHDGIENRPKRR